METSAIIPKLAKAYLSEHPDDWYRFVHNLAPQIANAAKVELASHFVTAPVQGASDILSRIVTESFMSPYFAHLIINCKNDDDARLLMSETIREESKSFEIGADEGYEGEIIDISGEGIATSLDDLYDEIFSEDWHVSPESYHVFKAFVVSYDRQKLDSILLDTINNLSKLEHPKTSSLVRLELIDSALYQALISNPNLLKSLNWRVFEKLLEDILNTFGYVVELQQGTKDGGIDLIAVKKDDFLGEHRYLLQAKRYDNKVGVEPVRQLLFLHSHFRATKSCLACTATFTKGAWELAHQYRWQLELKDILGLTGWLKTAANIKGLEL